MTLVQALQDEIELLKRELDTERSLRWEAQSDYGNQMGEVEELKVRIDLLEDGACDCEACVARELGEAEVGELLKVKIMSDCTNCGTTFQINLKPGVVDYVCPNC